MNRTVKVVIVVAVAALMFGLAVAAWKLKKTYFMMGFIAAGILTLVALFPIFKPGGGGGGGGGQPIDCGEGQICIKDTCPYNVYVRPDGLKGKVQSISRGMGAQRCVDKACFNRTQRIVTTDGRRTKAHQTSHSGGGSYDLIDYMNPITIQFPQGVMRVDFRMHWKYEKYGGVNNTRHFFLLVPVMNDSIVDLNLMRAAWLCSKGKPHECGSDVFGHNPDCGFKDVGDKNWDNKAGGLKYGNAPREQLKKLGDFIWNRFVQVGWTDKGQIWKDAWGKKINTRQVDKCDFHIAAVKFYEGVYTDKPDVAYDLSKDIPDPLPDGWLQSSQGQQLCGTGIPDESGGSSSVFWTRGDTPECKLDPYNQPYQCNDDVPVYCVGNNEQGGPNCGAQWMDLPLEPPKPKLGEWHPAVYHVGVLVILVAIIMWLVMTKL